MNRRQYLSGAGVTSMTALAGCFANDNESTYPSITTETMTKSPTRNTKFEVETLRQFSSETPAKIRAQFTNIAPEDQTFVFGPTPPMGEVYPQEHPVAGSLALVPDTADYPDVAPESSDDCWRLPKPYGNTSEASIISLSPDDTIATEYTVLSYVDGECLPEGRHQFTETFHRQNNKDDKHISFVIDLGGNR